MALRGGVLIIGSLLWDEDKARTHWRKERLNEKSAKRAPVPIRYGRFSTNRGAYTMVFSRLCYRHSELGQGVIVPFARSIATFDDLCDEAERLATAEGLGDKWKWGAVGLLKKPVSALPEEYLQRWTRYFRGRSGHYQAFVGQTRSEAPAISRNGFLNLAWPVSGKAPAKCDFLLATPTKARIQDHPNLKRYPSPGEVAALIPNDRTNYFVSNVGHGIRTSDDAEIWKAVTKVQSTFTAKWPQVSCLLDKRPDEKDAGVAS